MPHQLLGLSANKVIVIIEEGYKKTGADVTKNLRALGKLEREVEKTKCTLSSQQSVRINIESFEEGNDFLETLTRAEFEEIEDGARHTALSTFLNACNPIFVYAVCTFFTELTEWA